MRVGPTTPMVPIVGKPCMEHILELLRHHGFEDVLITVARDVGAVTYTSMLNRRGGEPDVVKVLDFGLVKALDDDHEEVREAGCE